MKKRLYARLKKLLQNSECVCNDRFDIGWFNLCLFDCGSIDGEFAGDKNDVILG